MIAAGRYRAVAVPVTTDDGDFWAQFGVSSNGNEQVVVNFEILDGEHAGETMAWFGSFTDKTADKTLEGLRNCGWRGSDLATASTGPLEQEVSIVVQEEEYQGKVRSKIRWVNRPGGGGAFKLEKPMARNDMKMFSSKMKAKAASIPEVKGAAPDRSVPPDPPPAAAPDTGAQHGADDVPF